MIDDPPYGRGVILFVLGFFLGILVMWGDAPEPVVTPATGMVPEIILTTADTLTEDEAEILLRVLKKVTVDYRMVPRASARAGDISLAPRSAFP